MPSQPTELIFPLKGLDEGWAYGRQPQGTTPDCQNVVPFDPLQFRARGGQRPGLSRYFPAQHNGTAALQEILSVASIATGTTGFTETFTGADGPLVDVYPVGRVRDGVRAPAKWIHYTSDGFDSTASGTAVTFNDVYDANVKYPAIVSNQLKLGPTETEYTITGVDRTARTFTVAENLSGILANDVIQIAGSTGNDGEYTVVSVSGSGPTAVTVTATPPDATVDGTLRAEYGSVHIYTGKDFTFSGTYTLSFDLKCTGGAAVRFGIITILFRVNPAFNGDFYALRFYTTVYPGSGTLKTRLLKGTAGAGYESVENHASGADIRTELLAGATITITITAAGGISIDTGLLGDDPTYTTTLDSYADYHGVGFAFHVDILGGGTGYQDIVYFDNFVVAGADLPDSSKIYEIVAVSGGDVFTGQPQEILTVATGGTNALSTTNNRVQGQVAFGDVYFADGDPANYNVWTQSTDTVAVWTPTAGTLPMGSNQTAVSITAATPATPSFTVAEDWSARAAGDYLLVAGSTSNDGYYTVASVAGTGPTVLTVNEAVADNTVDGTIQYQDEACRILKLYRGRIVMAGLNTDPQNWFMSAVGAPLDWDYGATVSATMAVAGNNTDAGEMADIITCLAPYSDDLMYMGGDHTLWLMRGDPAAGGEIDNISYQTGISGPDAYAFDPDGVFYFFGAGTVWRINPGGLPEPISRGRLDQTLGAIDLTRNTVNLVWDNIRHGLLIFVVPRVEGSTTHYYWDRRTDSFWKFVYPDAQGPTMAYAFDGNEPNDNALILGGWDGYLRKIDPGAKNDDGTAVSSHVYYPIIAAGHPLRRTRLSQLTAVLDTDSDDVDLTIYAEDTVQKVINATSIRGAGTLIGGRTSLLNRVAGDAIALKLSNTTLGEDWAIENLIAHTEVTGRVRKKQL